MSGNGILGGSKAVIIGGSKGIGKAITKALKREGAAVAVAARGGECLHALQQELDDGLCDFYASECDVRDKLQVDAFIGDAAIALGGIDILISCASSFAIDDTEAGWSSAFETDLMGTVRSVHAALPHLQESDRAAIITTSSVSARLSHPDRLPYGAMKAALEQYTESAALLYAPDGIRVNCLVVGSTDFAGSIWDRVRESNPALYETTRRGIPLGGFAKPEQVAEVALFLASPQASWITGQCVVVDGGQTIGRRVQPATAGIGAKPRKARPALLDAVPNWLAG